MMNKGKGLAGVVVSRRTSAAPHSCAAQTVSPAEPQPSPIERVDRAPLPQCSVERQALLEQGAGCDSITLLEMQQSQTIERPGDPLLEARHPAIFQALLEQRAHPRIRALIGVREEGERNAHESVDEAVTM